jgi:ABC-type branched-subunit amino acid transport system substrate-binding protein
LSDREHPGRHWRSLLTVDVVLRLAAVVLAGLIVVRALLAGASGLRSIVLVLAVSAALWGTVRLVERLRTLLARAQSESGEQVPASRVPALVTRARSRLAALLALLILVVHAAITGYVGVWTILVAIALAAIAALLSPDLRLVALLGGTAVVFAAATVFLAEVFRGSTEARALAISIAAVVLPVLVSDKIGKIARQPALTTTHHAILAILTLVLGFLGWTRADWLPGVINRCYTLPTSTGITVLRATADGERCYGLLDTDDPGVFATPSFGPDPVTIALERAILANNRALRDGDLTVVWLGALSCDRHPADATRCADGRDYPSERDQLRALLFAQTQIAAAGDHRLHVVIADAAQDVRHADDVAQLIISRRGALGERLVVIGGGDSRDVTQRAINRLLDAGIPFVAPNLLADLGAPGRPFVDRPGYLQLAPSNMDYATDTVARLARRLPGGFRLDIYQHRDPSDQYTTSLVNDLLAAVKAAEGATARHVPSLDQINASACTAHTDGPPTVLYFADRWTRFADFVQQINQICGHSRPRLVIADVSASRFMANYQLRAASSADWRVDYYVSGPGCADLTEEMFTTLTTQMEASRDVLNLRSGETFACADRADSAREGEVRHACTLDAAAKLTSQPCRPNDLGTYLISMWDAVLLADALLPARPPTGVAYLTSLETTVTLTTGAQATVREGRLTQPTIPVQMWHVDPLNDPSRLWERPNPELRLPTDPTNSTDQEVR